MKRTRNKASVVNVRLMEGTCEMGKKEGYSKSEGKEKMMTVSKQ
jgi:hypothetical protein